MACVIKVKYLGQNRYKAVLNKKYTATIYSDINDGHEIKDFFQAVKALNNKHNLGFNDNDFTDMRYGSDIDCYYFTFGHSKVMEAIK